jgi:hypothetical protein
LILCEISLHHDSWGFILHELPLRN